MAPHPVDVHVGQRLRLRRTMVGMSQEVLGASVGITFQQIQKYERGLNRIGSSRLYEFARILNVPISYFFEDFLESSDGTSASSSEEESVFELEKFGNKEVLNLVRAFYEISDPVIRKRVLMLVKSLANPNFVADEDLNTA